MLRHDNMCETKIIDIFNNKRVDKLMFIDVKTEKNIYLIKNGLSSL